MSVGYKEILDDLHDLLNANDTFKNNVSRHDFSVIADSGSTAIVLRVGGFAHQGSGFGGEYAVGWDFFIDIYETYSAHIEEDVATLVKARDTVIDIIEKNTYLGKGPGNTSKITDAKLIRGDNLGVVFDEDNETPTHFTLSVLVEVQQQHSVTLAE
ncbi:hypothetical protein LCGC14_0448640 [marine sediment metagenome]|uniref:Uncharacterized protein n=1 Tax=marine sediment metagenome TaxID=412755 RepID=A0A0F9VSC7_9ZZZZ